MYSISNNMVNFISNISSPLTYLPSRDYLTELVKGSLPSLSGLPCPKPRTIIALTLTGLLAGYGPPTVMGAATAHTLSTNPATGLGELPEGFYESQCLSPFHPNVVAQSDLTPLIEKELRLHDESYLELSEEEYAEKVDTSKHLIEGRPDENQLLSLITTNERQEQRLLLQYLSKSEQELLVQAQNSPHIQPVCELIQQGNWQELCNRFTDPSDAYVFLAAYTQKKIDITELATAMVFHRVSINAPGSYRIISTTELTEKDLSYFSTEMRTELLNAISKTNASQQFVILVDGLAIDPYARSLIDFSFIKSNQAQGYTLMPHRDRIDYGAFSFGIMKNIFPSLSPVIHLTPTLETMAYHLDQGRSDVVLLFPNELANVHGSFDKTIFGYTHDLFHTWARSFFLDINYENLTKKFYCDPNISKKMHEKLSYEAKKSHPIFKQKPTPEETLCYISEALQEDIVDGTYNSAIKKAYKVQNTKTFYLVDVLARYASKKLFIHDVAIIMLSYSALNQDDFLFNGEFIKFSELTVLLEEQMDPFLDEVLGKTWF